MHTLNVPAIKTSFVIILKFAFGFLMGIDIKAMCFTTNKKKQNLHTFKYKSFAPC